MAINDLYYLEFVQTYGTGGEEVRTNWCYRGVDAGATAQALHAAFGASSGMMGAINELQCNFIKNKSIKVINLFSLTDFYEEGVNGTGEQGAPVLPAFVALNFSLKLNTRGVKPGSKRIPGIAETVSANGIVDDAGMIDFSNALAALMAENIEGGDPSAEFEPVVIKRVQTAVAETEERPAYTKYNLPTNVGEADWGKVVAALVNLRLSHQVSRGNGR